MNTTVMIYLRQRFWPFLAINYLNEMSKTSNALKNLMVCYSKPKIPWKNDFSLLIMIREKMIHYNSMHWRSGCNLYAGQMLTINPSNIIVNVVCT